MCNVYCNIYIRCQYLMSHNFSPGNNFKHIDKIDFLFKVRMHNCLFNLVTKELNAIVFLLCVSYIKCCWLLVKHLTLALFQYAEMVSLPDDLLSVLDEFSDARNEALDEKVDCKKLYDECPSETIVHVMSKIKKLM